MHLRQVFTQVCRTLFLTSLPLTLVAVIPSAAQAAIFSRIYAFGDSLSDTGNSFDITNNLIPPSQLGYFEGRFSNGPIWLDTLADKLEIPLPPISRTVGGASPTGVNFAVNSATTGDKNTFPVPLDGFVGLQQQVAQFKQDNTAVDPKALYVLWAGANDYLGGGVTDPSQPVANLSNAVTTLFDAGARNFLVANLPSLGTTPIALRQGDVISNQLNQLSAGHNLIFSQTFEQLSKLPGINVKTLDTASLFNAAIEKPADFGFTNVSSPCLANSPLFNPPDSPISVCSDPDKYLFWDDLHPTSAAHEALGNLAFETIASQSQPVPEPSLVLVELAAGAFLGVKAVRKWKQKKVTAQL